MSYNEDATRLFSYSYSKFTKGSNSKACAYGLVIVGNIKNSMQIIHTVKC